ncbi:sensor histidine kinase [Polaribacter ponticola]|uniref:Histidine kinase n=1 Tax=Polaribacter ponticola TaxID=2978475 RepID=A0ABT5S843_9FLAO|nr:histidine kinase [Polaribacter sp. MSW5]MDD7914277.1 histidine kinase [Polaribacter sp. MSW5]
MFDSKKKISFNVLKPGLISSIIVFTITFLFFRYLKNEDEYSLFEFTTLFASLFSLFIVFAFSLFQSIKIKSRVVRIYNFKELNYSFIKLLLIPLSGILIYAFIIILDRFDGYDITLLFYKFLPIGFIFSLLSIHVLNYIFSKYEHSNRIYYIVSYYVVSISALVFWIIISFNNFRIVKDGLGAMLDRAFLLPSIGLYSPFFLYVLILTHFYFLSLINKQEKSVLKQQSLESQLNYQQLKNQISPHFLFNNINVLTSLIEENPKKAVRFSENLSHIYRYFLEQEKQDVVLVKEEIKFAKSYLELLKDRFEVGLIFSINIDKKLNEKYIVATILQQVLENVVKHNTVNEIDIVELKIISKENYLIIENNKNPKIETEQNSKKGIENIKKRVAFFTDEKVIIKNTKESFIIELPILNTI